MDKTLIANLAALVLWDGGVYPYGNTGRFYYVMNTTSTQLVEYAKSILEQVTSVKVTEVDMSAHTDGYNRQQKYRIETKSHPVFEQLREAIYISGYKSAPARYIKAMSVKDLAYMYMAEGSMSQTTTGKINSVFLNTKRLTEGDNKLLASCLMEVFGVEFSINHQKQYSYLRLKAKHYHKFFALIKPYILSDFLYKCPDEETLAYYTTKYVRV